MIKLINILNEIKVRPDNKRAIFNKFAIEDIIKDGNKKYKIKRITLLKRISSVDFKIANNLSDADLITISGETKHTHISIAFIYWFSPIDNKEQSDNSNFLSLQKI